MMIMTDHLVENDENLKRSSDDYFSQYEEK